MAHASHAATRAKRRVAEIGCTRRQPSVGVPRFAWRAIHPLSAFPRGTLRRLYPPIRGHDETPPRATDPPWARLARRLPAKPSGQRRRAPRRRRHGPGAAPVRGRRGEEAGDRSERSLLVCVHLRRRLHLPAGGHELRVVRGPQRQGERVPASRGVAARQPGSRTRLHAPETEAGSSMRKRNVRNGRRACARRLLAGCEEVGRSFRCDCARPAIHMTGDPPQNIAGNSGGGGEIRTPGTLRYGGFQRLGKISARGSRG